MRIQNTNLAELFPLALGTSLGGRKWKEEGTDKMFGTFLDHGGNVIDTARVYTFISDSEKIIGDYFTSSGRRDEVILISKGGHPSLFPVFDMHQFRLGKEEMKEDLNDSLRDLKTDYIDIYLYHRDDPERSVEELMETMEDFVREGKIRYYGVSNWTLPRIKEAADYCIRRGYRGPVMNQALINAASACMNPPKDDTLIIMDKEMQDYHQAIAGTDHDLLAAGYMGNCGGFFQQYLSGGDEMVRDQACLTEGNRQAAEKLAESAAKNGRTITQEVLNFYNTLPFPCLALFGPRNREGLLEGMEVFRSAG